MIVQSAPDGQPSLVITMDQHTAFAASLAANFGNDRFERVEPRELMMYVIAHHDAGWKSLDAAAPRDPDTGLPYNLVKTPFESIVATSSASPDFNGTRHPYCELISSMHSWGLYNGRYGMSEKVLLDGLAAENRALADDMLDRELERQARLRAVLAEDPETRHWIEQEHLFQNYKQLQFFDTLALYFNCTHEGAREAATFTHVPLNAAADTEVSVTPLGRGRYAFDPFPFASGELELRFSGRLIEPVSAGDSVAEALAAAPTTTQRVWLLAPEHADAH